MSGFTPGPWVADEDDVYAAVKPDDGGDMICERPAPHFDASRARWAENARLIAAAPELLEALQAYVAQHEMLLTGMSTDPLLMARAEAAIAKATGEQP